MAALAPGEKQLPVTGHDSDSDSSTVPKTQPPPHGSYEDHPFNTPATAQYWRDVYETAHYEGRHRFDPNYTWTAEEEKRLVRKVIATNI